MRKGDERREQILQTAGRLFYEKGYEQTSVQDILDDMNLSKGGFYHHFESKLQLLDALCERQMAETARRVREEVEALKGDAVAQVNALYAGCALWREDQLDFAGLVLRVAYRDGSVQIRDSLRQAMLACARPLMREIVHDGLAQKKLFTRYPDDIGELLLLLFANLSDEICTILATENGGNAYLAAILTQLTVYRHAAETLLGAPYGSLTLFELNRFPAIAEELRRQCLRLDGAGDTEEKKA